MEGPLRWPLGNSVPVHIGCSGPLGAASNQDLKDCKLHRLSHLASSILLERNSSRVLVVIVMPSLAKIRLLSNMIFDLG